MWKLLGCKNLQDYHDAYIKLECTFLVCVCGFHLELSFRTYKLDYMHFYTLPNNMAKEASLKICRAKIELMTKREHLHMIESTIPGGVTSVNEERNFVANKKYLSDYRPSEESTFAFCADANNVYRDVMQMDHLPVGEFTFKVETTLNEILNTPTKLQLVIFLN